MQETGRRLIAVKTQIAEIKEDEKRLSDQLAKLKEDRVELETEEKGLELKLAERLAGAESKTLIVDGMRLTRKIKATSRFRDEYRAAAIRALLDRRHEKAVTFNDETNRLLEKWRTTGTTPAELVDMIDVCERPIFEIRKQKKGAQ